MKLRASARAKERANISFFIFVIFFAVFGVIVLTELLMLERASSGGGALRARFVDDVQAWADVNRLHVRGVDSHSSESLALSSPPPAREPLDAHWQPVSRSRFKFFVYSAYVERRTIPAVRIIAATRTRGFGQFWCHIFLAGNRTISVQARVKPIRENWNLKFSACFVLCPLKDTGATVEDLTGASVSVVAQMSDEPTNMLKVMDTRPKKGIETNLFVCVKPLHFSYSRALWLLEWMELHLILGVSQFVMYDESLSTSVRCLLEHYRKKGLLTLLPWKLDIISKVEIRNQGQFAAFNDCLYRSMSSASWLLVLDLDEVILPRREATLPAMLLMLRSSHVTRPPAALLFRNAFFYTRWDDDQTVGDSALLTQRKTRRWAVPHAVKNRSKYAVRPTDIVELGNHFVWEFAPGGTAYGVPPERALLHHYRMQCEFGGNECLTVAWVTDRTAHRWGDELEQRVNQTHRTIQVECALQPRYPLAASVAAAGETGAPQRNLSNEPP